MLSVCVLITRFVDDHQPGFVECKLVDAWGGDHIFVDKVPIVALADLTADSQYPQPAVIACHVITEWNDAQERKICTIDTELPWHIQSTTGDTHFDVLPTQLETMP